MTDSPKFLQAIVELTGVPGAGKTTLATALGEELAPASVLFIDASPDQRLTIMLTPEMPELTLGRLFSQKGEATSSREAIDWVFHDLAVPAGEENELITVGALPDDIEPESLKKLQYGLSRLIENYAYVVIDGFHPLLHQLLPEETIRTVQVVTPEDFPNWRPPAPETSLHTPALILNRYSNEPLPTAMDNAMLNHQIRLIGKLPRYATTEDCIRKLSDDFRNCLLRLDIPFNLSSS
jgi:hypothetical protein